MIFQTFGISASTFVFALWMHFCGYLLQFSIPAATNIENLDRVVELHMLSHC